jgi:site-specific DNA-cytosine methylase
MVMQCEDTTNPAHGASPKPLKYISICSGIEAASLAFHPLGWEPLAFSEIEPFPCALLAHRYPGVPNLGDMTKYLEWPEEILAECDLLVGGPPCFPAGTMIATSKGFVPIEEVAVGELVLTHTGKFCRVIRTGSKVAKTVKVKGQGHHGFVTTANHPFLARQKGGYSTRKMGKSVRIGTLSEPEWVAAENLKGKHWACLADWPTADCPPITAIGNESSVHPLGADLFKIAGAYIGDGWVRINRRRGSVMLGINPAKLEMLKSSLDAICHWSAHQERTTVRVTISSRPLARWLQNHFGDGAHGKSIPMWALGLRAEWRQALLEGYIITDGGPAKTVGTRATTVSRQLALTMRALAVSCGYASSVGYSPRPTTCVIEGRTVNQSDTYTVSFSPSARTSFYDDGIRWQLVRSVEPTGASERVYDLEVDEDHSYVADGIIVHNCQAFSVAGTRNSLGDERGNLTLTYVNLIDHIDSIRRKHGREPIISLYENVPGIYSTRDNAFGCLVGAICGQDAPVETETGKWPTTGVFWGEKRRVGYRTLDAQYFGVAQRRRRCFLIAVPNELVERLGERACPSEILSIPESLRGDSPPSREAGKAVAALTANGVGTCGADDNQGQAMPEKNRFPAVLQPVTHALTSRYDSSENGCGRGTPLVPTVDPKALDTLREMGCAHLGTAPMAFPERMSGTQCANAEDLSPSLGALNPTAVAIPLQEVSKRTGVSTDDPRAGIGIGQEGDPMFTLQAGAQHGVAYRVHGEHSTAMTGGGSANVADTVEVARRLDQSGGYATNQGGNVILHSASLPEVGCFKAGQGSRAGSIAYAEHVSPTLGAAESGTNRTPSLVQGMAVRRITVTEAERLMGMPDGYTDVPFRGKPAADGNRYKALGNSMAVPCMAWLGFRIQRAIAGEGV